MDKEYVDDNEIKIEIELSEFDLEVFTNIVRGGFPPEVWTITANTGEDVVVKFIKDES